MFESSSRYPVDRIIELFLFARCHGNLMACLVLTARVYTNIRHFVLFR